MYGHAFIDVYRPIVKLFLPMNFTIWKYVAMISKATYLLTHWRIDRRAPDVHRKVTKSAYVRCT